MFCKCFDSLWSDPVRTDGSTQAVTEMMHYLIQMVQVQIMAGQ